MSEPINDSVLDETPQPELDSVASGDILDTGSSLEASPSDAEADAVATGEEIDEDPTEGAPSNHKRRLVAEGDIAADYLEGLLDIADLDGDIDMDIDGDRAAVSISGGDLGHLVGRNGEVLDALQKLTRLRQYWVHESGAWKVISESSWQG